MKRFAGIFLLVSLLSCTNNVDLQNENKELLQLTRELTAKTEELQQENLDLAAEAVKQHELAFRAAADARMAEANALEQVERTKAHYKNCKCD